MITIRKSDTRGHSNLGWLDSKHAFSFAHYHDPERMGFRSLRVFNDDQVAGGGGFDPHPHHDMEIVSYVTRGALQHKDNMGNELVLPAGSLQRMSAGKGVIHSEYNASETEPVHFFQIWLHPERRGIEPGHEELALEDAPTHDGWQTVASNNGHGGMKIHQDVIIRRGVANTGETLRHTLAQGRGGYVHVVSGEVTINGKTATAGDAAEIEVESEISIEAQSDAEVLLFDLG